MASVRIRCTSAVTLPITNKAPLRLSAFDGMFVSSEVPLNFVYLFPSPTMAFREVAESVKHSLAQALESFHPFAGELTYQSSSHTIAIVFPEKKDGCVTFVEAETDMGLKALLDAEELDADALRQLVPDIRREVLPAPVMAVQVTQAVGGVVVGLALDHTVADGHGLFHLLNAWTAAATSSSRNPNPPLPLHDRNLVRFDGDEELNRAVLRHFTPNLPRVRQPKLHATAKEERCPVVRQTFVFTAPALQHLKRRHYMASTTNPDDDEYLVPSTFVAMAAHGWVSFSRACSGSGADDDSRPVFLVFLVDCRPALMSSLQPGQVYAGNCVIFFKLGLKRSELTAPGGLTRALSTLTEAVREAKADPLRYKADFVVEEEGDRIFLVSGIPRFGYDLDLGFGRPARIERARLGYHSEAFLVAGRDPGSVHAMVAMAAENMTAFRQAFMVHGVHGRP